ncbi:arginyl-tRNA synthetase [Sporobacter termitidis DSM 10068]|uniref:Arginine--tRNA ligase n=1 Tax=Sporobacter termitidis DSM 10068 TaxID=1123282 RepID=A0A1M5WD90_9FIRM|nr:arginine--tRNA ligase [Sporobacter termitidis]SHH85184.1 arginyl-tRNA synthetase [Sporobacter termitidis DSM 10068]
MANLIDAAKSQIDELMSDAYNKAVQAGSLPAGHVLSGAVEIPRDTQNGDYAATHALAAARNMKMAPRKIAEAITAQLDLSGSYFGRFNMAGPGFINFTLSDKWYKDVLRAVETEGEAYGACDVGGGARVMVEFVSANPTGPMTIGNARGGVLGDTLAAVLEKAGYQVWREFYVNDAGNQVELFGKSIEARYMQLCLGEDNYEFPENGYHGDDIRALAQLIRERDGDKYVTAGADERVRAFVSFGLPYNIALMKKHLERYRINFDQWFLESTLHESGYVAETVNLLSDQGYTYEKDGAVWLKNMELGADKDEVLRRANGFYTYYAVDIAYHRNKFVERGFDRVIDIWGADHHGHAIRFKSTMTSPALGIDPSRLDFVIMQMVRLVRDGETVKVSKRTGKALTLNDLLDEISVDACRFFFNAKPDTHLEFDLGLAVRQDSENPVYYVQYAHARICSLLSALGAEGHDVSAIAGVDASLLAHETERDVIKQLSLLPEEIKLAARDYDPSRINRYVIELAARFHRFYNACRIKGEEENLLAARLKLADAVRVVIRNCLGILGVTAPEKM